MELVKEMCIYRDMISNLGKWEKDHFFKKHMILPEKKKTKTQKTYRWSSFKKKINDLFFGTDNFIGENSKN